MIRKALDGLYKGSGALASLLIAAICILVCTQVVFNLITRFGGRSVNLSIPSYGDFSGYFLAASSFLALAYTLTQSGHIRVSLVLTRLPSRARLVSEVFSLCVSTAVVAFATYHMAKLCLESYEYGDLSPGIIAVPIWMPQTIVLLGLIILTIALTDFLVRTIQTRKSAFETIETERVGGE